MSKSVKWLGTAAFLIGAGWLSPSAGLRAQHEGHGGHGGMMSPGPVVDDSQSAAKERRRKLERLQEKIDKLEVALESPNLSASQQTGLKKKLDKLYQEKDRLLGGTGAGRPGKEVYACSMRDYSGPKTPDGRCPKCGMTLRLQPQAKAQAGAGAKAAQPAAKGAAAQEGGYVCPMGDYSGPRTKDGRCPKCGMNLQKK